jgi:type I restriction enzyme R subunit
VQIDDLFKPPLSILNAAQLGVELFGEQGLQEIVTEMNEAIFEKGAA